MGTLTSLQHLASLANDPPAFAKAREAILRRHFAALGSARAMPIQELQSDIEHACAAAGTPARAVVAILDMMAQRLASIDELTRTASGRDQGESE